jgi:phosphotransferase system  glucose/maltose/N-acetylglucosamine-specific IIC component
VIAGLLALAVGVGGLLAIVGLSLLLEPEEPVAQIVSGAVSAIASIVAAYFGIKLGNDNTAAQQQQTRQAIQAQREEATKAQAFAAVLPPEEGRQVLTELRLPGAPHGGTGPQANA